MTDAMSKKYWEEENAKDRLIKADEKIKAKKRVERRKLIRLEIGELVIKIIDLAIEEGDL